MFRGEAQGRNKPPHHTTKCNTGLTAAASAAMLFNSADLSCALHSASSADARTQQTPSAVFHKKHNIFAFPHTGAILLLLCGTLAPFRLLNSRWAPAASSCVDTSRRVQL
ncbi:hypothetical protein TRVL_09495 [Trypanosoma vivax]|nr:hypothetical protein TRVL_09495 [Trypanosoma vivax]